MPLEKRLKLISALLLIEAILFAMAAIGFLIAIPAAQTDPDVGITLPVNFAIIATAFAIGFFVSYANFKKRRSWNRSLIMLLMVPSLFSFPIGTILSILVWSQLRKPEIKEYFTGGPSVQTENPK